MKATDQTSRWGIRVERRKAQGDGLFAIAALTRVSCLLPALAPRGIQGLGGQVGRDGCEGTGQKDECITMVMYDALTIVQEPAMFRYSFRSEQ